MEVDSVRLGLLLVGGLFALNMGGSGLAPAFSVALGAGLVSRVRAALLYGACVIVGALGLGSLVAKTLASGLVPEAALTPPRVLVVLGAATLALGIANRLKVPQSTSWVTVAALVALGLRVASVNTETLFLRLLPAWVLLPCLSFALTYAVMRRFYPVRASNLRLHERWTQHPRRMRALVLGTSCYVALAIGSNNVANAVGPLYAAQALELVPGFLVMAPLFGLGALVFPGPANTVGRAIVPMGAFAASVVSVIVGTLLLVASLQGIPQSLVQLNAGAVLAVWRVKEDAAYAHEHAVLRRMFLTWLVTPVIAAALTVALLELTG